MSMLIIIVDAIRIELPPSDGRMKVESIINVMQPANQPATI